MIALIVYALYKGWLPLDTFLNWWAYVFGSVAKSIAFSFIPFGFILGFVVWLSSLKT
jgi:hypothetical protein